MLFLVSIGCHYGLAIAFILILFFYFQYRMDKILVRVRNNVSPYLRVVAPFFIGDENLELEMFSILIKNLSLEKHFNGYSSIRSNFGFLDRF